LNGLTGQVFKKQQKLQKRFFAKFQSVHGQNGGLPCEKCALGLVFPDTEGTAKAFAHQFVEPKK
jgi:hypothetical protein